MRPSLKYTLPSLLLSLVIAGWWLGWAQQKPSQLQKDRWASLVKVRESRAQLSEIQTRQQVSLGELSLVNQQIQVQDQLLSQLEEELDKLDSDLKQTDQILRQLEERLEGLKLEYGRMIYQSAKSSQSFNRLSFVFASENFNQLFRRYQYLQQYQKARKEQVYFIQKTNTRLGQQELLAQELKKSKEILLMDKAVEVETLKKLKSEKQVLLAQLSRKKQKIVQELAQNQKRLANLESLIAAQVQNKNTNLSRPTRPNSQKKSKKSRKRPNISATALGKSFQNRRGKLTFPIRKGFIASRFGRQEHPVLKDVYLDNAGIDIQSGANSPVRACFKGEVSTLANIPGMGGEVLMIKHGSYFSVYAKIKNIQVAVGDWVEEGETIAEVHTDAKGVSLLQFQIWKGSSKLNPQVWLAKP